ncbi:spore cortex-lytic enzyme, lytic transglycosylase SleB [Mesobacillus selenatarsenatis SF-1]|uniref:Spore cortex-lytic enzyme n=1 Tax=Mesobacillus selenatarsenatis (strain DSM 18680 / JCM 14380 / FERM P-15431 / SF-1) TaxID=1321606 RepID=A0A0A8X1L3_MESS1|nr:spore cortex-lytic enzyme [Mesobacillus selenatarsenatis]GAM13870.1 spore cortex-lytic enzyme, lytic transglycosylase SleB [Mesobacillus selenatarsenatis SF-1]
MKNYRSILKVMAALALIMSFVQFSEVDQRAEAFTSQVLQQGSTGEDVIELQSRLKHIGFYNGKIDGVFGWGTYWALRNFQYEFGLEIDGVAGWKTKLKLAKATPNAKIAWGGEKTGGGTAGGGTQTQSAPKPAAATNTPNGFSQNDIQLMANAVYGEARGEPYTGQVAVAAVILNRLDSATFPNTISGVIFEPRAFTAVADGQIWLTPNETAKKAVLDAINGWDPTGNAMYYFNPDTATSAWIWSRPQIKKIGKHIFCK